jgi:hypothetical protein
MVLAFAKATRERLLIQLSNSSPLSSSAKADDPVFQRRLNWNRKAAGYWMPAFAGMTVEFGERYESASSRRVAPELCISFRPLNEEGAGKAGCWLHPWVPCNKKHGGRTTGSTEAFRLSLRDGVTVSFVLFPVTGLSCHRHPQGCFHPPGLSASVGAPEPHDFAVRCCCVRLIATPASTASHPNVRDDGQRPSFRDGTAELLALIWVGHEAHYFREHGWTTQITVDRIEEFFVSAQRL